jgi:competence protein ComEC
MKPNKPLVFYVVAFYIGCISYVVFTDSVLLGAVLAASFLIIILVTVDRRFSILILGFFIAGTLGTKAYYKITLLDNTETIRIAKNKDYYYVGRIKGRNVIIKGNLDNINEGDRIIAQGKFEGQVDYSGGIIGSFYVDKFKLYKADALSSLYSIRKSSFKEFEKYLGKEKAAVVMSLCFGETAYLSEEQKYDFQELGVVHAISVSGFHMAIIYKILEGIAGFKASIAISFIYMIFTGAQPATLRAFLMILALKLSKKVFRNYDSLSALSLSALIILAFRPYYVFDVGFILSYLSTLGIILYYNKIRRAFFKLPKSINESLSLTLSAQTFSMAYAGMVFNNVSFGFLLGNIILLPMYTAIVVVGNIALLFINVKYIFSLFNKLINIIILSVEGASYLLLKLTPPTSEISYTSSLAILVIVVCFLLTKKGFDKFKFVPIFVLGALMLQNYNFFPRIDYINLGGRDGIILSYKAEKVFIHNLNEQFGEGSTNTKFTKIISNPGEELVLRLGKNYSMKMLPIKEYTNKSIGLEISAYNNKTILTRNTEDFMDVDLKKYDIIKMPKQGYYPFKGKLTNKLPKVSYTVVFTKVYSLHKD